MSDSSEDIFDLAVLGAGPGGYICAIRSAQLGARVCLIERSSTLGGTCLNVGCIPSKALLESSELFAIAQKELAAHGIDAGEPTLDLAKMMQRKQRVVKELTGGLALLMKKNKVTVQPGRGQLLAVDDAGPFRIAVEDGDGATTEVRAAKVVLATGSEAVPLPFLPPVDEKRVVTSTGALAFDAVPEHLVVIGAGVIGLELGSVWARLGAKVSVIELLPKLLPNSDAQLAKMLQRALSRQGLSFHLGGKVTEGVLDGDEVYVSFVDAKGAEQTLRGDRLLVAVGRRPVTQGCGLEAAGVALDGGQVAIDDGFQTNVPGIYAIGDLVRGPMLAHKAEEEGVAVAELISGKPGHVNYDVIPAVAYTHPELAEVGLTEAQAKERGIEVKVGRFSFKANGRAKTLVGDSDGLVKLVADAETDRLLGAGVLGPRASDMIAELVLALEFSASSEDVGRTVHAHPSLAEIVKEAALAVGGNAIHG